MANPRKSTSSAAKAKPKAAKPTSKTRRAESPRASSDGGKKAYVAVELLSWRPHPLPRGLEVSEILPEDVLEACLADGRVTREPPEAD